MLLGGARAAGLIVPIVNVDRTTLQRGTVVSLATDADGVFANADGSVNTTVDIQRYVGANSEKEWVVPVQAWVTSTQALSLGVIINDVPEGYSGMVMVQGFTWCRTDGGVATGDKLEVITNGIFDTRSAGTIVGRAILTDMANGGEEDFYSGVSTETYTLAYVDFANTFIL